MKEMEKRSNLRMACLALIDFGYRGRFRRGFIKNLSFDGAFIETSENMKIGEKLVMSFEDPFFRKKIRTSGEIVWIDTNGCGIKFVSK